jgi:hypothetical protein
MGIFSVIKLKHIKKFQGIRLESQTEFKKYINATDATRKNTFGNN